MKWGASTSTSLPGAKRSTYRVVQEGLTNALRYAAGAAIAVLVRVGSDTLAVEVRNAPAPSEPALAGIGTGTGLQGLRERIDARGGTLEAGPTSDGGWKNRVSLPLLS
jgi:signal transduction histidine kinase